ncbi:DUF294 nucleotidyltransferase-like domain-containing protein [Cupriavidus gilardii]|uniref:DUF294 nucleotidyltransferase-like domain-containing protein n=1 Tax=Cupriavidus gilardii TaxID=82541 RepID=UPI001572FEF9|nr:DUF294 nucleotidyltransferase-like domain-containing protein [Cupriavidus gilardii]NSX06891.1 hypothetical protein [Cupriavidus gilardii]
MFNAAVTRIGMLVPFGIGHSRNTEREALRQAIDAGNRRLVKDLLAGTPALATSADDDGESPLHWAVRAAARDGSGDRRVIVTCLLEAGADPAARSRQGLTPLDLAAQVPYDPAVLSALRRSGRRASTPAHHAGQVPERNSDKAADRAGDWGDQGEGATVEQRLQGIAATLRQRDPAWQPDSPARVRMVLRTLAALYRDADADCAKSCLSCLRLLLQRYPRLNETHRDEMVCLYEALVRVWMRGSHWQEGFCYAHHARRLLPAGGRDAAGVEAVVDRLEAAMVREHLSQWAPRAQAQLRAALFDLGTQCAAATAPIRMLERAHCLFEAVARAEALLASYRMAFAPEEAPREAVPVRQLTAAIVALLDRLRRTAKGAIDFIEVAHRVLLLAEAAGAIGLHAQGAAWCDSVVRQVEQEECAASLRRYDCSAHRRMAQSLRAGAGAGAPARPAVQPQPVWRALRDSVEALRRQAAEELAALAPTDPTDRAALCDWDTPLPIEGLQEQLTARYKALIAQIARACRHWMLTEPPCAFAIVGLGSMSRGDMGPYSDFEYAVLLAEPAHPDSAARAWFARFCRLFDLAVCSLGETVPGHDHPLAVPAGFQIDAGVREGASALAWTGTPEQLADALRQRSVANANVRADADQGLHFSLLTPSVAHGDEALMRRLRVAMAGTVDVPLHGDDPGRLCAREDLALRQLHADLRRLGDVLARGAGAGTDLKQAYRGPLVHTLTALSLLFGHDAVPPRAALARLDALKRFSTPFLADWRWAMAAVQTVRYRLQLSAGRREEQGDAALTGPERDMLQAARELVVRPLWAALSGLVGSDRQLPRAVIEAVRALRRLDDVDPALPAIVADRPLSLAATRNLAATLAVRRAPADELRRYYEAAMAGAPRGETTQRWIAWRDALGAVPGNEGRLRALGHLPWPDGWRAQWAESQSCFRRAVESWLVDAADAADAAGVAGPAIQVRVPTPVGAGGVRLSPDIARQLFDAHGHVLPKPAGQAGSHCVLPVRFEAEGREWVCWVKFGPEAPGSERLLHALDRRLTGGRGMAASLAMQLRSGGRVLNVQVTEDVAGRSLATLLREEPSALRAIDPASFTRALLRELVSGPGDDKADDYFLERGERQALKRIDSGRAGLGMLGLAAAGRPHLPVRSYLFCLDQMVQPLDLAVLDEVGRLQPDTLLRSWLEDAFRLQQDHGAIFGDGGGAAQAGLLGVTPSDAMPLLRQRLESVIGMAALAARLRTAPTGMACLRSLEPELAAPYLAAFERHPVRAADPGAPAQRFACLDERLARRDGHGRYAGADPIDHAARFGLTAMHPRAAAGTSEIALGITTSAAGALSWLAGSPARDLASLVVGVLSGREGAQRDLAALPLRQRTAVFDTIAMALHADTRAVAVADQRRLLAAMEGTAFVCLDLSPFAAALTDPLLEGLLRGAGPALRRLDLSGCAQLTPQVLRRVEALAPALRMLNLRAMRWSGDWMSGEMTLAERPAAPLIGPFGPLQWGPLHWSALETLDLFGNGGLQKLWLRAPALRTLRIDGCAALRELRLDGVRLLHRLDASQCVALPEPVLCGLARDNPELAEVRLAGCTQLRHIGLREAHPWLLAWPWNAWSQAGAARLCESLTRADGSPYRPMPRYVIKQVDAWLHERERAVHALTQLYRDAGTPQRLREAAEAALLGSESVAQREAGWAAATLIGNASDSQPAIGIDLLVPALSAASSEATRVAAAGALGGLIAIPSRDDVARWARLDAGPSR